MTGAICFARQLDPPEVRVPAGNSSPNVPSSVRVAAAIGGSAWCPSSAVTPLSGACTIVDFGDAHRFAPRTAALLRDVDGDRNPRSALRVALNSRMEVAQVA